MKGWKTVIFGVATIVLPAILTAVGGIDWTSFGIHPALAGVIGAIVIGLRAATSTPIGKAE